MSNRSIKQGAYLRHSKEFEKWNPLNQANLYMQSKQYESRKLRAIENRVTSNALTNINYSLELF